MGFTFLKSFSPLKFLGWTSGFRATVDLTRKYRYETEYTFLVRGGPRAGPGVERIGRTPLPLAQSVETWPIGVRLVCRELRPVSLEERILVIERVGCGRHATHYFGLNFS